MARRIFVHIGRNKTGTATVQRALQAGRQILKRNGFHYPKGRPAHHYLAQHLAGKTPRGASGGVERAKWAGELAERIASSDRDIVLSSEFLMRVEPSALAAWLGKEATVVVYIREQVDYLASCYQQGIKMGIPRGDFASYLAIPSTVADGYYLPFLRAWEDVFGRDNLVVRVYDRERLVEGDIVADFLSVLGVDGAADLGDRDDRNPSAGGPLLEALRRINTLDFEELRRRRAINAPLADLALGDPAYRAKQPIPPDVVAALRDRFAEDNAAVSARYFDGGPLFAPRPIPAAATHGEADVRVAIERLADGAEPVDPDFARTVRDRLLAAG